MTPLAAPANVGPQIGSVGSGWEHLDDEGPLAFRHRFQHGEPGVAGLLGFREIGHQHIGLGQQATDQRGVIGVRPVGG